MLAQHYPIIGSSSRICWQVTMCARLDTGKENQDKGKGKHNITIYYSQMTRIICHVDHLEYTWTEIFCWYKACYCYCWFTWSERFCHRISLFNAEIIHATNGYYHWGGEFSCIYISGYICRKVSRSACDQCKVILLPIINCIPLCLGSNIWIFKVWGFCSTSKQLIGSNERIFGNIPEHILHRSHNRDQIITFIKDTKSRASCDCFTLKGLAQAKIIKKSVFGFLIWPYDVNMYID